MQLKVQLTFIEVSMTTANKANSDKFYKELENGNWDNKPSIVINPFKRKEAKKFFGILGIIFIAFVLFLDWSSQYKRHLSVEEVRVENDAIKSEMKKFADEGKVSAILWMVKNYPQTEERRLDALLEQKNSDALLLKSELLYQSDKEQSIKYIKASALEGNALAIMFLKKYNKE